MYGVIALGHRFHVEQSIEQMRIRIMKPLRHKNNLVVLGTKSRYYSERPIPLLNFHDTKNCHFTTDGNQKCRNVMLTYGKYIFSPLSRGLW